MRTYLSGITGNEYRLEKGVVMVNYAHYEGDKFCESQLTRESFNHRVAGKHWSLMSEPTPPPTLHLNRNMAAIIATQPPTAGYTPVNHSEINFNF